MGGMWSVIGVCLCALIGMSTNNDFSGMCNYLHICQSFAPIDPLLTVISCLCIPRSHQGTCVH